jgi:molybdate transport system substrate-binding protein
MKLMKWVSLAVLVLGFVLGSWVNALAQSEITLLAVGPMRAPTEKVVANFQMKTGRKVKITYGNGNEGRRIVAKGQPLDVSILIGPFPGAVSSRSIVPSSMKHIATVQWVLAVPKGRPKPDISNAAAVKKAILAANWIGFEDPDFTIAGQGPLEALQKLGIADQMLEKSQVELGPGAQGIPPGTNPNTTKTITRLENGDIDIALHWLNDLIGDKDKYEIVGVLPKDVATPTPVVGFLSAKPSDAEGAKLLLDYLASPEAQAVWKEAGFGPPIK